MATEPTVPVTEETAAAVTLDAFPGGQYQTIADLPPELQAQAQRVRDVLLQLEGVRNLPPGIIEQVTQKFEENDLQGAARILWAHGVQIGNPIRAFADGVDGAATGMLDAAGVESGVLADTMIGNGYVRFAMESFGVGRDLVSSPIELTQAMWADLTRASPDVTAIHFDEARAERVAAFFVGSIHSYEQEALAQPVNFAVHISAAINFASQSLNYAFNHVFGDGTAVWKSYSELVNEARVADVMPSVTSDMVSSGLVSAVEARAIAGQAPVTLSDGTTVVPGAPLTNEDALSSGQTIVDPGSETAALLGRYGDNIGNLAAATAGVAAIPFNFAGNRGAAALEDLGDGNILGALGNAGLAVVGGTVTGAASLKVLQTASVGVRLPFTQGTLSDIPGLRNGVGTFLSRGLAQNTLSMLAYPTQWTGQALQGIANIGEGLNAASDRAWARANGVDVDVAVARGAALRAGDHGLAYRATTALGQALENAGNTVHTRINPWLDSWRDAHVTRGVFNAFGLVGGAAHAVAGRVVDVAGMTAANRSVLSGLDASDLRPGAPIDLTSRAPVPPTGADYMPDSLRAATPSIDTGAVSALPETPVVAPRAPQLDIPAASDAIGDAVRAAAGDIHVSPGLRSTTPLSRLSIPEEIVAAAEQVHVRAGAVDVPGAVPRVPRVARVAGPLFLGTAIAGGATLALTGDAEAAAYNAASSTPIVGTGMAIEEGRTTEAWFRGITDAGMAGTVVTAPAAATGGGAIIPALIGGATAVFNELGRPVARLFGADVDPGLAEAGIGALLTDDRTPQARLVDELPSRTDAIYSPAFNALIEARNAMVEAQARSDEYASIAGSAQASFTAEAFAIPMETSAADMEAVLRANFEHHYGMTGEEAGAAKAAAELAYKEALDAALADPSALIEVSDISGLLPGVTHLRREAVELLVRDAIDSGNLDALPESLRPLAERQMRLEEERAAEVARRQSDVAQGFTVVPEFMAFTDMDALQNRIRMEVNGLAEGDPAVIAAADTLIADSLGESTVAAVRGVLQAEEVPPAPAPAPEVPVATLSIDGGLYAAAVDAEARRAAAALRALETTGGDTVEGDQRPEATAMLGGQPVAVRQ